MSKEKRKHSKNTVENKSGVIFDPTKVKKFYPFKYGQIVFGGYFGDEGKGKEVDIIAEDYKLKGLKVLSIRGQGSGNAGHTVVVDGVRYDFHYLTSAGLLADTMLLGPGMLIDPIRVLEEAKKLPKDKRNCILVAERAAIVTELDRAMDEWCENERTNSGQAIIGTTKSGVGPGAGNRGYRVHVTFADARNCMDEKELKKLFLKNPLYPKEVKKLMTDEYSKELWKAIKKINVVSSEAVIEDCRQEGDWAVLLEISQAVCLDPLFGNGGHFTTSTPCTNIGGATGAGLTLKDFPDGSVMVLKAYGSKVGSGPFITKFSEKEKKIGDFIYDMVGEKGVTTGRKRDLGWFDGPAVRHSIALTGAEKICINCMDVISKLSDVTDKVKICFAYKNVETDEVTYDWPYDLSEWEPLYLEMPLEKNKPNKNVKKYIKMIEKVIGKKIHGYGVGPSRMDFRLR